MVEIILVRHGLTLWNRTARIQGISDVELSEEGLQQAKLLAEKFPFDEVHAIYSSDLARAKDTAQFIADKFNLPVQIDPEFREVHFGAWEGKTFAELEKTDAERVKIFHASPDKLVIEGAETFQQAQTRAMNAIKKLVARHESKDFCRVVVVTHGCIIRTILSGILGVPLKNLWRIRQSNTGVTAIHTYDNYFTLSLFNSTAHLPKNLL